MGKRPVKNKTTRIRTGKYKHYRGNLYQVIGMAKHGETLEEMVLYRPLSKGRGTEEATLLVRPAELFEEKVEIEGKTVPRFKYLEEDE
jgi:hypothetical protein